MRCFLLRDQAVIDHTASEDTLYNSSRTGLGVLSASYIPSPQGWKSTRAVEGGLPVPPVLPASPLCHMPENFHRLPSRELGLQVREP